MKRLPILLLVGALWLQTIAAASFSVITSADSGVGSLRQAILAANGAAGADTITFAIPDSDPNCDPTTHVCTITPVTSLPTITGVVVIDGYTQPGTSMNTLEVGDDAVLRIELNGANAVGPGLLITAGDSTVRGLVVNGFSGSGILLQTGGSNIISGSFIGTDAAGAVAKPNDVGVEIIDSANNLIGGALQIAPTPTPSATHRSTLTAPLTPGVRDLLSGNTTAQVLIESGATGNQVEGNYIGPNAAGNTTLSSAGQRAVGIIVRGANNIIGGIALGTGNLISGNANEGIFLNLAQGTRIQGNLIGTDGQGSSANSNGIGGVDGVAAVSIGGGSDNVVGGAINAGRNIISGNTGPGIEEAVLVDGSGNTVSGNLIGAGIFFGTDLGNSGPGILVQAGSDNALGGAGGGEGNIIAFNDVGIEIRQAGGTTVMNNAILSNSIFSSSSGLGIDLYNGFSADGVTPNDPCDDDLGPNNFQNFPVITSATSSGISTTIDGTLNSTANTTFRIEFFSSAGCNSSGNGEGQTFLGSTNVTTDASCNATFSVTLPTEPAMGSITATATDPTGNTSEFSACSAASMTASTVLANISTRLLVETGDNVLIGGFIANGTASKKVIVRAIGPSLPLSGSLADPQLELHDSLGNLIASNDNWQDAPNKQEIIDSALEPANDLESAILSSLPPGLYTAIVAGTNATTGVALVEAYDLDQTVDSKLANISTRGLVQTLDNVMIGGFIAVGIDPLKVLVRAIGPSLPVDGKLANPNLELYDANGLLLSSNDNWRSDQEAEIIATNLQPTNDLESAILMTLPPAAYTAIVRGVAGTTGVALVEVYALQ
jgi:hypothetical protein